jgi:RND family efflux transporter MFP subunit
MAQLDGEVGMLTSDGQIHTSGVTASTPARTERERLLRGLTIPRHAESPGSRPRRLVWLVAAVLVAHSAVLLYLTRKATPPLPTASAALAPAPVASISGTAAAGRDSNTDDSSGRFAGAKLEASGFVAASRVATVSARTLGVITQVLVEEGAEVAEGQVVARLDDTQARLELRLAEAREAAARGRVRSAEAQLTDARRSLEREQSLWQQQITSESSLTRAGTTAEAAAAGLESARADLEAGTLDVDRLRVQLNDHTIRAPFAGVVVSKNAQPGEVLAPSGAGGGYTRTGICTIVDMKSLEIVVDVNEQMIDRIHLGQAVEAELYAHAGWVFSGRVHKVMPNADRARGTVRVRIELLSEDARILPDKAVKVAFL